MVDNMNQYKDDLEGGIIYLNEINKERARNGEELIALECNTGGIQYGDDKYMPAKQLLQLAINLGIPISIGSDCHYQNEVGRQFKQCFTDLQNMGLQELCYFKKKRMQTYSDQLFQKQIKHSLTRNIYFQQFTIKSCRNHSYNSQNKQNYVFQFSLRFSVVTSESIFLYFINIIQSTVLFFRNTLKY
ncbi:Histidinol-phosphatase [Hexamita inflata]|uniref:Histidinol-phosphatase n=1 Tax=Hexamita inflata TaxID=28002 RepID=A0ABP1KAK9_9EUKA